MAREYSPEVKAAEHERQRQVTLDQFKAEIRRIAMGKQMPTMQQFDESKPAVWRNGALSAERMVRRTVITANNASKEAVLQKVNAEGTVRVQKQAMASIGPRTTRCCLRVHGQIRDIGQPFDLTAEPRFARQMMHPAFHWGCRTSEVMYHPVFERGGLTTANMRSSAAAELRRRGEE